MEFVIGAAVGVAVSAYYPIVPLKLLAAVSAVKKFFS